MGMSDFMSEIFETTKSSSSYVGKVQVHYLNQLAMHSGSRNKF